MIARPTLREGTIAVVAAVVGFLAGGTLGGAPEPEPLAPDTTRIEMPADTGPAAAPDTLAPVEPDTAAPDTTGGQP